ncbi:hypothetical protein ACHAPD_005716 [Fusarium lateritium]
MNVTAQLLVAEDPTQQNGRWKFDLIGLRAITTAHDIASVFPSSEKPCLIAMGDPNYDMDIELDSILVKSMLYEKGELERWSVSDNSTAKRIKAHATFVDKSHAQVAASSLNQTELPFNSTGKLFVQLITSVKFKVSVRVYNSVKKSIDAHKSQWSRQFIHYSALPERGFNRILKIEGEDRQLVAQAKRTLENIITGTVMTMDGKNIWYSNLKISKNAYRKLQKIEQDLEVVIIRDIRASNFRAFGPEDRLAQAADALQQLVNELKAGDHAMKKAAVPVKTKNLGTDCSVCFGEAEESLETSCGHIYCNICFVNMCQSGELRSGDFSIRCVGDSDNCKKILPISEIQTLLLSETLENILDASFASFIRSHPTEFRYCPTPDCDQVYRVSSPEKIPFMFTCARCFTPTCTACHASHPGISCSENKGNGSDDIEKLIKAKKDMGVKDCPKCTTAIQKSEASQAPDEVSGQAAFWILVTLATAAIVQPSARSRRKGRDVFDGNIDLLRCIPAVCFLDSIADLVSLGNAIYRAFSKPTPTQNARRRIFPQMRVFKKPGVHRESESESDTGPPPSWTDRLSYTISLMLCVALVSIAVTKILDALGKLVPRGDDTVSATNAPSDIPTEGPLPEQEGTTDDNLDLQESPSVGLSATWFGRVGAIIDRWLG